MQVSAEGAVTALIHLYRGELGRLTAYRARLDATTNWAVGATAAMISFALGNRDVPHFVALFALVLDITFLFMEARRFQFYEVARVRVRLLERGFFAALLEGGGRVEPAPWVTALRESLERPRSDVTLLHAVGHRLRYNYLWLLLVVYAGWIVKLAIHGGGEPLHVAARIGWISGSLVLAAALALLAGLAATSIVGRPEEEE